LATSCRTRDARSSVDRSCSSFQRIVVEYSWSLLYHSLLSAITKLCWRSAGDPIEHVARMEASAPHAEALRDEQAAPVGAPHRLFVAADEFRHFEPGHHSVRQSARRHGPHPPR